MMAPRFARMVLAFVAALLSACGGGEASISLIFPNDAARAAMRRLRVEIHGPEATASQADLRDCNDFLGKAAKGAEPTGALTRGEYQCTASDCGGAWFEGRELARVPPGRQIVFVLAYASTAEDAAPILEGCSDRFDAAGGAEERSEVPVRLSIVLPSSARLVKHAGDRQVGRAGAPLAVPLAVRVEAETPRMSGGTYTIPGVPVRFNSTDPRFELSGPGESAEVYTDVAGIASVGVQLPDEAGLGEVVARAPLLANEQQPERAEATFFLSVTPPASLAARETIDVGALGVPMALALGQLGGGPELDVALLGCAGDAASCAAGAAARAPFGGTRLAVVRDVGAAGRRVLSGPGGLGVLPAGLALADLVGDATPEVVIANSRRADCQGRVCPASGPCACYGVEPGGSCPCEGAEVLALTAGGESLTVALRQTLTGSNAAGLALVRSPSLQQRAAVAVVAQGRAKQLRPCSRSFQCLPLAMGGDPLGCPPGETCESSSSPSGSGMGVCIAHDKIVDILERDGSGLVNKEACRRPSLTCDPDDSRGSTCTCLDNPNNACRLRDKCGCRMPTATLLGIRETVIQPTGLTAGPLRSNDDFDLVVASDSGLGLLMSAGGTADRRYEWKGQPVVNVPVHEVRILDLDGAGEARLGAMTQRDLAWVARAPCTAGSNYAAACPVWRDVVDAEKRGCLGVYYTSGEPTIFDLRTPVRGGCRRHHLPAPPSGLCVGRFNDDEHSDLAVASSEMGEVWLFNGDGRGGLLDPPERVPLPPRVTGGPIVCGDLDGDGLDDVLVASMSSGALHVLRSGP